MNPISRCNPWRWFHWFLLRLSLQGTEREALAKWRARRKSVYDYQTLEAIAREDYGYVDAATERALVERLETVRIFMEDDAALAPREQAVEAAAREAEYQELIGAPVADLPQEVTDSPDFAANLAWVMENYETYVRDDPAHPDRPSRIVKPQQLRKRVPSNGALFLLKWAARNNNKFVEMLARVAPKKVEKEQAVDERYLEEPAELAELLSMVKKATG